MSIYLGLSRPHLTWLVITVNPEGMKYLSLIKNVTLNTVYNLCIECSQNAAPCVNPHKFLRWLKPVQSFRKCRGNAPLSLCPAEGAYFCQTCFQVEKRQENPWCWGNSFHPLNLNSHVSVLPDKFFFKDKHVSFFLTAFTFWTWQVVVFVGVDSWKKT